MVLKQRNWWREGVCYQIWPASFKDANGDGFGDLKGIISKLDYLRDLGVDFIWISPCYDSPRHDMGYDIRNYEDIDRDYGALQDMEELIRQVHNRGMKVCLDLVINHTSNEHKWFQESMKSRDSEYSDYYIWRDPKIVDGKKVEPNNWASLFGGSAWKYVSARDQYYLHLFLETQPDVDWENPTLRQAIYQTAIRFWLDRGVDGFRVDTVNLYSKPVGLPDTEVIDPTEKYQIPAHITNGPRIHEFLQEQRREVLDAYGDVPLIGELGFCSEEDLIKYLDPRVRELDMIFDMSVVAPRGFPHHSEGRPKDKFNISTVRSGFAGPQKVLSELNLWPTVFIENHDNPRSISRWGSHDSLRDTCGKCLALLLGMLSGTLFIYQGQEIGMPNLPLDWPLSELRDEMAIRRFKAIAEKYPGSKQKLREAKEDFQYWGRDHSRTPVQWTSEEPAGGFSTVNPWMKSNPSYRDGVTVEDQLTDKKSLWNFWKTVVALRKADPELYVYGTTEFLDKENLDILFLTKRTHHPDKPSLLGVLNFSDKRQLIRWPEEIEEGSIGRILLCTVEGREGGELGPREGRLYELVHRS